VNVSSVSPDPTQTPAATPAQQPGRQDFLNLLVSQLQHQDPLQPMEGAEFVAQLAQFSSVEQLLQINERLGTLEVGQAAAANSAATAMLGKQVTANADQFRLSREERPTLAFELDGHADDVTATIADEAGQVVRTIDLGERGAGAHRFTDATPLPAGTYHVTFSAESASGVPVNANSRVTGAVTEVSFENGYPELIIDGVRVRLGDVIAVGTTQPAGA